jgi:hypothetical protein
VEMGARIATLFEAKSNSGDVILPRKCSLQKSTGTKSILSSKTSAPVHGRQICIDFYLYDIFKISDTA